MMEKRFAPMARGAALVAALATLIPVAAHADQTVTARDNGAIACVASKQDLTRIALQGDQFAAVSKATNGVGAEDFDVVHEPTRGDIYISVPADYARDNLSFFGTKLREVPVRAYDLTEAGKAAVSREGDDAFLKPARSQFCYGTPTIDEVVQYTEPADAFGVKVSRIEYRYHLEDLPDWTKNEKLRTAFPQLAKDSVDSLDGRAAAVLTSDGWVHEKAAKLR